MTVYNKDIDKLYNDHIADYLSKGYMVSPTVISKTRGINTSCCSSIELVNPKIKDEVIRIFVDKDSELEYLGNTCEYVMHLNVYAKKYKYTKEDWKNSKILWYDEGELLFSKKYYCIPKSRAYVETLDELAIIYMIRENREKQKCESKQKDNKIKWINLSDLKPETIDSIMVRINRMRGFKAATASCIQKIGMRKVLSYNYNLRREVPRVESLIYVDYKSKQTTICLH